MKRSVPDHLKEKSPLSSRPQNQPKPRGVLQPVQVSGNLFKKTHKLSLEERALLIKVIARYKPRWTLVVAKFKQLTGHTLDTDTAVRQYRNRPDEVEKAKQAWLAELRGEHPLAVPLERIGEYSHKYGLLVRSLFRVPCPDCLGTGVQTDGANLPVSCPGCYGRKWVIPGHIRQLLKRLQGDVRLETIQAIEELWEMIPPDAPLDVLTKMQDYLEAIRAECGDHWSPREKQTVGDTHTSNTNVVVLASSDPRWREQLKAMRQPPALPVLPTAD